MRLPSARVQIDQAWNYTGWARTEIAPENDQHPELYVAPGRTLFLQGASAMMRISKRPTRKRVGSHSCAQNHSYCRLQRLGSFVDYNLKGSQLPSLGGCPDQPQKILMRADGGFDSRKIFEFCRHLGITPYVNMTRSRGIGTMAVLDQMGGGITDPAKFVQLTKDERESNHQKRERVQYGQRWLVEIII